MSKSFAVVTGASAGIGLELAKCCAAHGYDLLLAADQTKIHSVADELRATGRAVEALQVDLSSLEGVEQLYAAAQGRPIDALLANAGHGLGKAFLDQETSAWTHVIDTNITGTLHLLHKVGREMRARRSGRILITGSIAGFMPGTYQAVYNATKAFIDSFSFALRAELMEAGVTVTCLMPGATETEFFARADMLDTKVGTEKKQPADEVARIGFEAMLRGDGDVVTGWKNKVQQAIANVTPSALLAELHRKMAAPGSAHKT